MNGTATNIHFGFVEINCMFLRESVQTIETTLLGSTFDLSSELLIDIIATYLKYSAYEDMYEKTACHILNGFFADRVDTSAGEEGVFGWHVYAFSSRHEFLTGVMHSKIPGPLLDPDARTLLRSEDVNAKAAPRHGNDDPQLESQVGP